jgi:hypothetical protein
MARFAIIDIAPDPAGVGVVAAVILFVVGFVVLLAAALVVFLWYRKRSMRHREIGRPDADPQFVSSIKRKP